MTYRILSFCGGGIRGLLSAGILKRLAAKCPTITANAELLAGTSTGAQIISQLLANKTPAQIYDTYLDEGVKLLAHPGTDPKKPAYNVETLVAAQLLLHKGNPRLNALAQTVLFTAFNVGSANVDWQPLLLSNVPNSTTGDTLLADAVVSSSAMPGMYGSHKGNVDGAWVNHDPTLAAIALAVSNGYALNDIVAICFGTGFMGNRIPSDTSDWDAHQWQFRNEGSNTPPLFINGTESPVLNMSLNGTSTNLTQQLSSMLLGERYVYLNATLDRFIPENDTNPVDLTYLEQQAEQVDLSGALKLVSKYWNLPDRVPAL